MLNIKKIKPLHNYLVVTKDEYTEEDVNKGGLITKIIGSLKEYQTVVSVGPMIRDIKVGDIVMINPSRYAVRKHQAGSLKDGVITDNPVVSYNFNVVELDHVQHLLLVDSDIEFIIEESEEEIIPKQSFVIPKKEIIV